MPLFPQELSARDGLEHPRPGCPHEHGAGGLASDHIVESFARHVGHRGHDGAVVESGDAVSSQAIGHEHATNPGGGRRGCSCVEIEDLDRLTVAVVDRIEGVSVAFGLPDAQAVQVGFRGIQWVWAVRVLRLVRLDLRGAGRVQTAHDLAARVDRGAGRRLASSRWQVSSRCWEPAQRLRGFRHRR